ncbi:hypothetical protein M404DRAFT_147622 [Pisolithus tinctorius Marx 270]|uniref:Retrotransposon gag domain-containing protein n=1 Tax=Pisolithus tinctorius Marx 270 TaxID=870435 RepID=A0A0C3NNL8_PISTI|nr:hypothetical protein M404DRAFT_147622 [Pisolithus tinctorius Marx 270]
MLVPAVVQTTNFDPTKRGVAKPSTFDGSMAKYEEWVIKMRAYCKAAVHCYTSQDCMVFWTWMTGPVAGNYAHAKLDFHLANTNWPTIDEVVANLNSRFWPMNNGDWAQKTMQKARQGQSQMDTFLVEFNGWKLMASTSDDLAILCLEQAINPKVLCLMHHLGKRKDMYKEYVTELWVWPQNQPHGFSATGMQPGAGAPMYIGATQQQGKGKGSPKDKSHITCFGCGLKGHY